MAERVAETLRKRVHWSWRNKGSAAKKNGVFQDARRSAPLSWGADSGDYYGSRSTGEAKLSNNKFCGPADVVLSEMIKAITLEQIYVITRCFQQRFMGIVEAPNSWKIVQLVCLRKPDAVPSKGYQRLPGYCLNNCNEQMVCVMHDDLGRERTSAGILE